MLTCKHCGATKNKSGKPFAHQGALNIHESIHCPQRPTGGSSAGTGASSSGCCEKPEYRFLRAADQREAVAIAHGYKKVCTNCEEVI